MIAKLLINTLLTWIKVKYGVAGVLLIYSLTVSTGQIYIQNPSLEGIPQDASFPDMWMTCDPTSTPDILPGPWGILELPRHGGSYVGLIYREDGSHESLVQHLRKPLQSGQCYTMQIALARAPRYAGFNAPGKLMIRIGSGACKIEHLVFQSPLITHEKWLVYEFEFQPEITSDHIQLEVIPGEGAGNGHILIDHLSDIETCQRAMGIQSSENIW